MDKSKQSVVDSVHQRLLNKAREAGRPFNEVLQYYAMEKFLLRMSKLSNAEDFVLKGALLLRAIGISKIRATRDIDVLKYGSSDIFNIEEVFAECCRIEIDGDGLVFDPESVEVEEIRAQEAYDGMRAKVRGNLGNARITIQIDVGFGDVITPGPVWVEYPSILEDNQPRIRAYTLESSIAEKYQAMVNLDMANSRMKDFYDIYFLSQYQPFEGERLQKAIKETFERRKTDIPEDIPTVFTQRFYEDEDKIKMWKAFKDKISDEQMPKLEKVVKRIREFLWPATEAINKGFKFTQTWGQDSTWE